MSYDVKHLMQKQGDLCFTEGVGGGVLAVESFAGDEDVCPDVVLTSGTWNAFGEDVGESLMSAGN